MNHLPPPQTEEHRTVDWKNFNPGYFNQDLVTLPLEVGLIAAANAFYTPHATPLWPFDTETTHEDTHGSSFPRSTLFPVGAGISVAILSGLSLANQDFSFGTQGRGWLHAALLTEVATSATKLTFQRKRPNYNENEIDTGGDSRFSFVSGHASQAFSFATYSSLLLWTHTESRVLALTYAVGAYSLATIVATSRVRDHAHNETDVIVGGLIGTAISAAVFYRVQHVEKYTKADSSQSAWRVSPRFLSDENGKRWYGGELEINL